MVNKRQSISNQDTIIMKLLSNQRRLDFLCRLKEIIFPGAPMAFRWRSDGAALINLLLTVIKSVLLLIVASTMNCKYVLTKWDETDIWSSMRSQISTSSVRGPNGPFCGATASSNVTKWPLTCHLNDAPALRPQSCWTFHSHMCNNVTKTEHYE